MKHGYFKGNCAGLGINYNGVFYDFPVFDENFLLKDTLLNIEVTDVKTKFAYFLKKRMDNKYLEVEEGLIQKIIETFPKQQITFIEKEASDNG